MNLEIPLRKPQGMVYRGYSPMPCTARPYHDSVVLASQDEYGPWSQCVAPRKGPFLETTIQRICIFLA